MCGEGYDTRMEELAQNFDDSGLFMDGAGDFEECDAQQVAKAMKTTPQVAGKVMRCFDDIWRRTVRTVDGKRKVIYVPREEWAHDPVY